ncbi:ATP-binding cassette domain-containing protein [Trueperella pecoris]|uniref:ATP-binding cassette domain-containing protein n=1 Tax=Trueperella pecoris TaxID=2733571 RepID=A0A7M1R1Q8_9ACTO|nr:ATP-binding cassette domain-containing protein [Trueperella pecoris]QOR48262.1 ATP-binding cassette domain-containing protein [Trueperella pecoris]
MSLINLENLRVLAGVGRNRRFVLEDVSLRVAEGSITTILGSTGSGKSALMAVISGLTDPESGLIEVDGLDISRASRQQKDAMLSRTVGVLFPRNNLLPSLTLGENLDLPAALNGTAVSPADRRRVSELFGIDSLLGLYPDAVTGLERQRCALAGLVLSGRKVLLCDEPGANLDQREESTFFALLRMCTKELGFTVVTFTTNAIAAVSSDHVYLLSDSRIVGELRSPTLDAVLGTLQSLYGEEV